MSARDVIAETVSVRAHGVINPWEGDWRTADAILDALADAGYYISPPAPSSSERDG